jgi:hypothetical protein
MKKSLKDLAFEKKRFQALEKVWKSQLSMPHLCEVL